MATLWQEEALRAQRAVEEQARILVFDPKVEVRIPILKFKCLDRRPQCSESQSKELSLT